MKKNRDFHYRVVGKCKTMFSISYMMTVLLLCFIGIGSKHVCAQERATINLSLKNATIQDVLWAIEKQTEFVFVYNEEDLNRVGLLDVKFQGTGVEDVLKFCLKGTDLEYVFKETIIVIKPRIKKDDEKINSFRIFGKVIDQDSIPLPGVTILLKGTSMGCVTDKDGHYRLSIPGEDRRILVFSFIGMKTKEVVVSKDTNVVNVLMEMDVTAMDEVVITGYEVIDKRKLTSSITTLKSDEIMEPVKSSLDQMLQGKVAGMSVMMASSTPGAAPKIRIRGSSSIVGNREPLWVLDGIILEDPVPLDVTELNSMDRVNLIGNAISGLNPEDIERIDVLKDASATAIYGTKAANGVIVITTKRGKTGPPSIRYSTSLGFIARPRVEDMRLMNSRERIEVSEEMHVRGLQFVEMAPSGDVGYEGKLRQLWNNEVSYDEFSREVAKLKMLNTDWYKLLFRNAFNQNHTVSASGANDKINYYFSLGYGDNRGAEKKVSMERFNFSSSLDLNVTERLKIGLRLSSSFNTNNRFHSSIDLYNYAYSTSRAISPYNEDGSYHFYDKDKSQISGNPNLVYNIFNELENSGNVNKTTSVNSQLNVDYNIASFLRLNAVLAYAKSVNKQREFATEESFYVSTYRNTNVGEPLPKTGNSDRDYVKCPFGGILDESNMENSSYTGRLSLAFNQAWGVHSISGSVGMEARSSRYEGLVTRNYGYIHDRGKTFVQPDPMKDWSGYLKELGRTVPRVTDKRTNTMSYYATFSYGYDSRYIFNVNVRGDGSNKLGEEEGRFLPIWSISGRWNVANESFVQNCSWINELSFRGSFGLQGNVTDAHNPNMVISLGSLDTRTGLYESTLSSLPNPGLLWEKTVSYNLALDFSIFKGTLSGSLEYYEKKGKDQLATAQIASTNGATSVVINNGTMENKGWELSLSATPVQTKNVTWGLTFNTGKNWNKVTGAEDTGTETYQDYLNGSLVRNGKAVNSFYSYRYGGLKNNGLPTFLGVDAKDEQGNTLIMNITEAYEKGFVYSGKREADFTGGFSTYIRYKKLSLNMNFAFSLGAYIRLNDLFTSTRLPMPSQNMQDEFVGRWREPGDEAHTDIPALWDGNPTYLGMYSENGTAVLGNNMWEMYDDSDLRVVSGDFLRCRGISLSYTVADSLIKKIGMKGLTLGCGVSNPFVIKSKDLNGRDPEQVNLGSGAIPPQPTYSFSLSATF